MALPVLLHLEMNVSERLFLPLDLLGHSWLLLGHAAFGDLSLPSGWCCLENSVGLEGALFMGLPIQPTAC